MRTRSAEPIPAAQFAGLSVGSLVKTGQDFDSPLRLVETRMLDHTAVLSVHALTKSEMFAGRAGRLLQHSGA